MIERAGYQLDHTTGSHYIYYHPSRPGRVVVPYHGGRDIKLGVLRFIMKQMGVNEEEFRRLL